MHTAVTVAVIDDDESVRCALRRLLSAAGMNVLTYASGEDFFETRGETTENCVVLDINLGGISGFEVQGRLEAGDTPVMPIIFISAYSKDLTPEQKQRPGFCAYFHKPVPGELLLGAIRRAVDRADAD